MPAIRILRNRHLDLVGVMSKPSAFCFPDGHVPDILRAQTRDKSSAMCFNRDYYKYGKSTTGESVSGKDLVKPLFLDGFQEGMTNGS